MRRYDYIITGAGCAGLSLAMQLIHSGAFTQKKILLVDRDRKSTNDRTWCFWENGNGLFEDIVYHSWDTVWYYAPAWQAQIAISPYRYKMIRGIDFYSWCLNTLQQHPQVEFLTGNAEKPENRETEARVRVNGEEFACTWLFNSIEFEKPVLAKKDIFLLQHFTGWNIETPDPVFNPGEAVLMDFRVQGTAGSNFGYLLPWSETEALVEYTAFSKQVFSGEQYRAGLEDYLERVLGIHDYVITATETGIIPMTNHQYPARDNRIVYIGTAGGQTKPSTGYTFRFIQQQSQYLTAMLMRGEPPVPAAGNRKYRFYDSVLLDVLATEKMHGEEIFTRMFQKNDITRIFRFLDNASSLADDLRIIRSLPVLPFLRAAANQLF